MNPMDKLMYVCRLNHSVLSSNFPDAVKSSSLHSMNSAVLEKMLELGRSDLLTVMLINALYNKNIVMAGILMKVSEKYGSFQRPAAYRKDMIHAESLCNAEVIEGAREFASIAETNGLIDFPVNFINLLRTL